MGRLGALLIGCMLSFALLVLIELGAGWLLTQSAGKRLARSSEESFKGIQRLLSPSRRSVFLNEIENGFSSRSPIFEGRPAPAREPNEIERTYSTDFSYRHPAHLRRPLPGVHGVKAVHKPTGLTIFDVSYTVDERSHRFTPRASSDVATKFAIFLGCSYVFGEGVNDDETIPYFFEKSATASRSYNFSFIGDGPNNTLAYVRAEDLRAAVDEQKGIIAYVMIPHHMDRLLGRSDFVRDWGSQQPYFYENAEGRIIQDRDFGSGRPWPKIEAFLLSSSVFKLFSIQLPPFFVDSHFRFFARTIRAIKTEYLRQFPQSEFYFVFYPDGNQSLPRRLAAHLDSEGIDFVDYSRVDLSRFAERPVRFPYDGHPTAEANRIFGEQLAKDLSRRPEAGPDLDGANKGL